MSQASEQYLKQAIRKSYTYIKQQLTFNDIIDHLYEKHVVTINEKIDLETMPLGDIAKGGKLLDLILMKENKVVEFVEILRNTHEHLYELIMDDGKGTTGVKGRDESDNLYCSTMKSEVPDGEVSAKTKSAVPVEEADSGGDGVTLPKAIADSHPDAASDDKTSVKKTASSSAKSADTLENIASPEMKLEVPSEEPVGLSAVAEHVPDETMAGNIIEKDEQLSIANNLLRSEQANTILTNVEIIPFSNALAVKEVITNNQKDQIIIQASMVNPAIAKNTLMQALRSSLHHNKVDLICEALENTDQKKAAEKIHELQKEYENNYKCSGCKN